MRRMNGRTLLATAAVVGLAVAGPVALARGDASSKQPEYASDAETNAGAASPLPALLTFGGTSADASTNQDGSAASSGASGPTVLGIGPADSECASSATDGDNGVNASQDSDAVLAQDLGVASLAILSTSCETRAVKSNNGDGSARASVVEASVAGIDAAVLTTSSDAKTTSGNARADSSFAVVDVEGTKILECSSSAAANNGTQTESADTSLHLLDIAVPIGCPGQSSASHTRTGPQG